jgi:predicted RNase H-like HicB family nuclease
MIRAWESLRRRFFRAHRVVRRGAQIEFTDAGQSGQGQPRYLVVTYPHDYGWVTVMPDFRGATGRADDLQKAMLQALKGALKVCSVTLELGKPLPEPLELSFLKKDHVWGRIYGVDWSRAVVHTICADKLIAAAQKKVCEKGLYGDDGTYAQRP